MKKKSAKKTKKLTLTEQLKSAHERFDIAEQQFLRVSIDLVDLREKNLNLQEEMRRILDEIAVLKLRLEQGNLGSWQDDQPWNRVDEVISSERERADERKRNKKTRGIMINLTKGYEWIKKALKKIATGGE